MDGISHSNTKPLHALSIPNIPPNNPATLATERGNFLCEKDGYSLSQCGGSCDSNQVTGEVETPSTDPFYLRIGERTSSGLITFT
eukprot:668889-Amorphochlora_amoeboformis.AAC.1